MITFDNMPKAKIEPFSIDLPRPLSQAEIFEALEEAVSRASLPNRDKSKMLPFDIPLKGLFHVEPSPDNASRVSCTPDQEAVDDQAVRWCVALTRLPPKSLPRTQRPIINLLKRLPEKPTGNPAFDKGRRVVLDRTNLSLWPAIVQSLTETLVEAANRGR